MDKESQHICNLRKGDTTSFEYLYTVWSGKLYNFVMRISKGDSYLAEEIVQAVFIKVWEGKESLDPGKSFGAYLCTIAKNQLRKYLSAQNAGTALSRKSNSLRTNRKHN